MYNLHITPPSTSSCERRSPAQPFAGSSAHHPIYVSDSDGESGTTSIRQPYQSYMSTPESQAAASYYNPPISPPVEVSTSHLRYLDESQSAEPGEMGDWSDRGGSYSVPAGASHQYQELDTGAHTHGWSPTSSALRLQTPTGRRSIFGAGSRKRGFPWGTDSSSPPPKRRRVDDPPATATSTSAVRVQVSGIA